MRFKETPVNDIPDLPRKFKVGDLVMYNNPEGTNFKKVTGISYYHYHFSDVSSTRIDWAHYCFKLVSSLSDEERAKLL